MATYEGSNGNDHRRLSIRQVTRNKLVFAFLPSERVLLAQVRSEREDFKAAVLRNKPTDAIDVLTRLKMHNLRSLPIPVVVTTERASRVSIDIVDFEAVDVPIVIKDFNLLDLGQLMFLVGSESFDLPEMLG